MVMENKPRFKAFITKYALTDGIKEVEVEVCDEYPGMVKGSGLFALYHGEGKEWHRTRESAVKKAEEMRVNRIASLKKQITKLEKLKFT